MVERIEQNLPRFDLVSDDLAEISRYLKSPSEQANPTMRVWTRFADLSIFETPYFDERGALQTTELLMKNLMVFGHNLPTPVLKLQHHYTEAMKGGDHYIRYALTVQKNRLKEQVKGIPEAGELEKTLNNIRRGINRVIAEIDQAGDPSTYISSLQARVKQILRHRDIDESKATDVVDNFLIGIQEKINALFDKLWDLEDAESDIQTKLKTRNLIDPLLENTLKTLANITKPNRSTVAPTTKPVIPTETPRTTNDGEPTPSKAKPKPSTPQIQEKQEKPKFDSLQATIQKIKSTIDQANGNGKKIRILIPPENKIRARFEPQWHDLLTNMGFNGNIEFVVYEDLRATTDTNTPIIFYKGMNTHGNLWDKSKFTKTVVIDFVPALIINFLDKTS